MSDGLKVGVKVRQLRQTATGRTLQNAENGFIRPGGMVGGTFGGR